MSRIVTVSGGGFATTVLTPFTSVTLLSLADTAICALAPSEKSGSATSASRLACDRRDIIDWSSPCSV